MGRITFTAEEMHEDIIEDVRQEIDAESTAGAVRECIERAAQLQQRDAQMQQRDAQLQQRIEDLEQENQRLRNEKRTLINDREEHTELVEYVEEQREDEQRERERRHAPAWRRAKWWLLGEPRDDREGEDSR